MPTLPFLQLDYVPMFHDDISVYSLFLSFFRLRYCIATKLFLSKGYVAAAFFTYNICEEKETSLYW